MGGRNITGRLAAPITTGQSLMRLGYHTSAKRRFAQGLRRELDAARRDRTPERFYQHFEEGVRAGHLDFERDLSLRCLFEEIVPHGRELVESFNPNNLTQINLMEAADVVSTTHFANITGQIVYSRVLDSFDDPQFLGERLTEKINSEFESEKIPGIGGIGDAAESIGEGNPYPNAGMSERWIDTPRTTKHGLIVEVTKEAVFYDRTGLVLRRAGEVGRWLGLKKEKRILDTVLGITTSYRVNGGAAQATYGDTHTNGTFDNLLASTALVDWTDVEAALLLFDAMTDPNTGEPIDVVPNQIIVPSALKMTAARILSATQVRYGAPGSTTNVTQTDSPNPLANQNFEVLSSQYVKDRTSSDTTWYIGDFKRAFAYIENWPLVVVQAPDNNEAEFTRDVVARFKASEKGEPAVLEPRRAAKVTA